MSHQTIVILDLGGQNNQLAARRVRDLGVYCEVKPFNTPAEEIKSLNPAGIIFTGGSGKTADNTASGIDKNIYLFENIICLYIKQGKGLVMRL